MLSKDPKNKLEVKVRGASQFSFKVIFKHVSWLHLSRSAGSGHDAWSSGAALSRTNAATKPVSTGNSWGEGWLGWITKGWVGMGWGGLEWGGVDAGWQCCSRVLPCCGKRVLMLRHNKCLHHVMDDYQLTTNLIFECCATVLLTLPAKQHFIRRSTRTAVCTSRA